MIKVNDKIRANYIKGFESLGGQITFNKDGFIFEPHAFNIQNGKVFVPYKSVVEIKKRNTLGIVPNGVSVIDNTDKEHKLVVNKRNDIIEFLKLKSELK